MPNSMVQPCFASMLNNFTITQRPSAQINNYIMTPSSQAHKQTTFVHPPPGFPNNGLPYQKNPTAQSFFHANIPPPSGSTINENNMIRVSNAAMYAGQHQTQPFYTRYYLIYSHLKKM